MALKKSSDCKAVRIQTGSNKKVLSKEQKRFNLLIKKIENKKKLFKEWDSIGQEYKKRLHEEYNKLYDEYDKHLIELLHLLDAAYPKKLFSKTDKNKITSLICYIVEELLSDEAAEDIADIYNKYVPDTPQIDEELLDQQVGNVMKSLFEKMTGVTFEDDVDISSPEKFQAALEELTEKKRSTRKKTAKQLEKEAKLKQQEEEVSKSIQEIYRKMVAVLHPDREQDEVEKVRKTKLMQEVNVAYSEKNLLRLFELQLELEHIDQAHLGNIAEEKLKLFNTTLQNQLRELTYEIGFIENLAKSEIEWHPFLPLSPNEFRKKMDQQAETIKEDIMKTKRYIEQFASDKELKAFLKSYKIPKQQSHHEIYL